MTYHERRCRELWSAIVLRRDRHCILQDCGSTYQLEAHHIFLKAQGNWKIIFDPDYGATLCRTHHPQAHGTMAEEIFERIIQAIMEDEPRVLKILKYKNEPKKPQIIDPPYKIIFNRLKTQLKEIEKTAWMDDY